MPALSGVAVFAGFEHAELERIAASSRMIEARDGMRLFAEGDAADAVYAVVGGSGHVRIGALDRNSKGLMIEMFGVGDIFGEIGVIEGGTRTADAVVEGHLRLLRISGSTFMQVLSTNPLLGTNLCGLLAARLRRTFAMFRDATFETLEVRLARQVLYLAERDGRRTEQGLRLAGRFRQGDLADLLGATTRSIITILNAWRATGMVIYDATRAQLTICREEEFRQLVSPAEH